ncbi:hypothetical protein JTE90_002556 [Oedothorax gibbosus]|uniref:Uncharacterized protein n=1 Tax=Oedothorax gibbosus TaxID=931172 RepID=A0AAV6V1T3_9ARAC|nr:hypothetical protein JTE90_002556 [Oedothorax gibbosus]
MRRRRNHKRCETSLKAQEQHWSIECFRFANPLQAHRPVQKRPVHSEEKGFSSVGLLYNALSWIDGRQD